MGLNPATKLNNMLSERFGISDTKDLFSFWMHIAHNIDDAWDILEQIEHEFVTKHGEKEWAEAIRPIR